MLLYLKALVRYSLKRALKLFNRRIKFEGGIYTLHSVIESKNDYQFNSEIEVDLSTLELFIDTMLMKGYQFVSITRFAKASLGERETMVCLTSDDGYANNYFYLHRLLEQRKIPHMIFVTTDFIDQKIEPWWYLLEESVLADSCTYPIAKNKLWQKNRLIKNAIFDYLRIEMHNNVEVLDAYIKSNEFRDNSYFMTWDHVREIENSTYGSIGSHGKTHKRLSMMNESELAFEIYESNQKFIEHIGYVPRFFSIPFGQSHDYNDETIYLLKNNGFDIIVTTEKYSTPDLLGRSNLSYEEL